MNAAETILACLDELEGILTDSIRAMHGMRECVRRNDNAALAQLLRNSLPEAMAQQIGSVRERIADAAGVPVQGLSLERLARSMGGPAAIALNDRRERLRMLVRGLQDEAGATGRLVRHALEFNVRLLGLILGTGDDGTYSADGEVALQCRGATLQHTV